MKKQWVCRGLLFVFAVAFSLEAYGESNSLYYELLIEAFENNESLFRAADITIEGTSLPPEESPHSSVSNRVVGIEYGTLRQRWILDGQKLRVDFYYKKSEDNNWQVREQRIYDGKKVILYNLLQKQAHIKSNPSKISYDYRVLFGLRDAGGKLWSEMIRKYPTEIEKQEVEDDTLFILSVHARDPEKIDKIWVSTSKGFRVVKEEYYNSEGELRRLLEYSDFENINDQMWLPKSAKFLYLVPSENGSFVYNQKKWRKELASERRVINWRVNQPIPPELFTIKLPKDIVIFDDIIGVQVQ